MAEISQIEVNGVLYDLKDTTARQNTGIELDTEMLDDSERGVQNKVIKAYVDNTVVQEVTIQIETQVQDTIQESVDKAVEDALSGGSSSDENNDEIDSWF